MKNWKLLAIVCVLGSTSAHAANEIRTPRKVEPAIKVSDRAALDAFLVSLVEEYEGKKVSNPADELVVDLDPSSQPCKLAEGRKLVCEYSYSQERWDGEVSLELAVENGRIVELKQASFGGSY